MESIKTPVIEILSLDFFKSHNKKSQDIEL